MASASVKSLAVCFAIKFVILFLLRARPFADHHRPFASFLLLSAFRHVGFPAVSARKPAVEEVVVLLARNLEANKTEVLSRDNGLLTFATDNDRFEFHSSPLQLSWLSLVGKAGFAMSLDLCWTFAGALASGQARTRSAPAPVRSRVRKPNGW